MPPSVKALADAPPDERPSLLVPLLAEASATSFWPLFLEWFPHCEDTWRFQRRLLPMLRAASGAYPHMSRDAQAIFDGLPLEQYVLRGCAGKHRRGLSWTDNFEAADGFARWHSACGRRANVYEAIIYKPAIFAVIPGGRGLTILVDYKRLRDIQRVEERPTLYGDELTFEPDLAYRDENDDGSTAELNLRKPLRPIPRPVRLPPIENMRQSELEAMVAQKRKELRFARLRLHIASLEADISRAQRELMLRTKGALPGRKRDATPGANELHWGQKRKSGGRHTNASKIVTKPTLTRLTGINNRTTIAPPKDKAA